MLIVKGEVRKVIDKPFKRKSGDTVDQAIVILEPEDDSQNYQVYLSDRQLQGGIRTKWEALKGKTVSVPVSLFVNYDYKFHKFNALGSGEPMGAK